MSKHAYSDLDENSDTPAEGAVLNHGLPRRLLTAFEVAEFVGCHEETMRRAYLRGLLVSQRLRFPGRVPGTMRQASRAPEHQLGTQSDCGPEGTPGTR